jgi:hypothetical protein
MRRNGSLVRWGYLGLADLDATSALASGEAHVACFAGAAGCGLPETRELLDERVQGWIGYEARPRGGDDVLLALAPRFAGSVLGVELQRRLADAQAHGLQIKRRA